MFLRVLNLIGAKIKLCSSLQDLVYMIVNLQIKLLHFLFEILSCFCKNKIWFVHFFYLTRMNLKASPFTFYY